MNISKLYAVGSLWLLVCAFALSNNQSVAMERSFVSQADEFRDAPPVSHLTVEGHFQPTIIAASMMVVSRTRHSYPFTSSELYNIYSLIAKGEYQTAIEELKKLLSDIGPIEDFSGYAALDYSEALSTLAVVYELNGNWKEAINLYTILYPEWTFDFTWIKIRIFYAVGRKKEAFKLICDAIGEVEWASPKSVNDKFERAKEEASKYSLKGAPLLTVVHAKVGRGYDPEWRAIWILRDNCARVACPEAPYVSAFNSSDVAAGVKYYFDLQKESFETLIDFMEEQYQNLAPTDIYKTPAVKRRIEYLKEINQIPYK